MSRLSWLTAKAWPDADGVHVWLRHECDERGVVETMLPNIWRRGTEEQRDTLTPSVICSACEMHTFVPITDQEAPR